MHMVNSIAQVAMLLKQGIANRVTSATTMNAHSSRSHAIFTIYLQVIYSDPLGHQHIRKAKLNLVDLAGSERHGGSHVLVQKYQLVVLKCEGVRVCNYMHVEALL